MQKKKKTPQKQNNMIPPTQTHRQRETHKRHDQNALSIQFALSLHLQWEGFLTESSAGCKCFKVFWGFLYTMGEVKDTALSLNLQREVVKKLVLSCVLIII